MKKHALKNAKQSPFSGDDLTPTVFVYNEQWINGKEESGKEDGVGDPMNENANLLSIVQYLIEQGEQYNLNREIQSFVDPEVLKQSLDMYPSFFFMTDMEWETNKAVKKADPKDSTWLPVESKQVLRDYVAAGGTIVQTGTVYGWDVDFLNQIFDLNLSSKPAKGTQYSQAEPNRTWERQAVLGSLSLGDDMVEKAIKVFEGLDTIDATDIQNGTYTSLYGAVDDSLVGVISYGEGKIYFVGSDYRKSGYPTNWGFGPHEGGNEGHIHNGSVFVQQILPAILKQAAK